MCKLASPGSGGLRWSLPRKQQPRRRERDHPFGAPSSMEQVETVRHRGHVPCTRSGVFTNSLFSYLPGDFTGTVVLGWDGHVLVRWAPVPGREGSHWTCHRRRPRVYTSTYVFGFVQDSFPNLRLPRPLVSDPPTNPSTPPSTIGPLLRSSGRLSK